MAAISPPVLIDGDNLRPADQWRMVHDALAYFPGVKAGGGRLAVTQRAGSANMSVDVADGFVVVPGGEAATQGAYLCENQGVANVVLDPADPSFARADLIVARVDDSNYSGAVRAFTISKVTGVAGGGAPIPTPPANSWVLARVLLAGGQTTITNAAITDARFGSVDFPAQAGQAILLGGTTFFVPSRPRTFRVSEGLLGFETANDRVQVHDGSNWTNQTLTNAGWTNLTYAGFWASYGAPYENGAYRKCADRVYLRGLLKVTSGAATGLIATLPVGFRPPEDCMFGVELGSAAFGGRGRVDIKADGTINLAAGNTTDAANFTTLNVDFSVAT